MNRELKTKQTFKIESVEEWKARGGNIQRVDFRDAYDQFHGFAGRVDSYQKNNMITTARKKIHMERLEQATQLRQKLMSNENN